MGYASVGFFSIRVLQRGIVRELWTDNPQRSIERTPENGARRAVHMTSKIWGSSKAPFQSLF